MSNTNDAPSTPIEKLVETPPKDYISKSLVSRQSPSIDQISFEKILERVVVDNSFIWHENRQHTEYIIQRLKEKRVLFIRAPESYWLRHAALRLATVLNSSINRLWPNCDGVYRLNGTEKFAFSCWEKQEFEKTKLIIVPRKHTAEYLDRLLNTDWDTAHHTWLSSLHKANICLVIPVPYNEDYNNYFNTAEDLLRTEYAVWDLQVISLELTRLHYNQGLSFYEELKITSSYNECNINSLLRHLAAIGEVDNGFDEFKLQVTDAIVNYNKVRDEDEQHIIQLLKEKDSLKVIIIFVAAFFENISIGDFQLLVTHMIGNKELPPPQKDENRPASVKFYKDIWSDFLQIEIYRDDCRLQTFVENNITYVRFRSNDLAGIIQQYFLTENRMMFSLLYKSLTTNDILFSNNFSKEFYPSLVKVILTNASQNITNHNAIWLVNLFRKQAIVMYSKASDADAVDDVFDVVQTDFVTRYFEFVQQRLVLLMQHMLMRKEEDFTHIINEFFRLLLDKLDKKELAIKLAIRLYNELKDREKFSATQVFTYFRQALNESEEEERFLIYDQMHFNFDKQDMYQKTEAWIKDPIDQKLNKYSRQYAWLFRLDYCILSFHEYITKGAAAEDRYNLYTPTLEGEPFTRSFIQLLEDICNKECLESWYELLNFKQLFLGRFKILESIITGEQQLIGRDEEKMCTVITLAADIYENWFYIISTCNTDETLKASKQQEFGKELRNVLSKDHLVKIKSYWLEKNDDIYEQTILSLGKIPENIKEDKVRIEKLKTRREKLKDLLVNVNA